MVIGLAGLRTGQWLQVMLTNGPNIFCMTPDLSFYPTAKTERNLLSISPPRPSPTQNKSRCCWSWLFSRSWLIFGRGSPGVVLGLSRTGLPTWLSLCCLAPTIPARHWSSLDLLTQLCPLIGWLGVVRPGEAGCLIIFWFVVFIIFYYQMLKLQVIFKAAIISVNHAQFRWLARFALNTSVLKGLLLFFLFFLTSSTRRVVGVGYIIELSPCSSKIVGDI